VIACYERLLLTPNGTAAALGVNGVVGGRGYRGETKSHPRVALI